MDADPIHYAPPAGDAMPPPAMTGDQDMPHPPAPPADIVNPGLPPLTAAHGAGKADLSPVHDIPVRIEAVLGRARMALSRLIALQSGDVVELDRTVGEPVDILINNRPVARGEIVMIDDRLGVTLTEIIRQDR